MNNSKTLFQDFIHQINVKESKDEISSMAYLVFEHLFGISKTEILIGRSITASGNHRSRLTEIANRINRHEPLQYILEEAEFFGRRFKVNASVLIPRPETEELVREIKNVVNQSPSILDIGTGSGCIPITLALEIPNAIIYATDVSDLALALSEKNAKLLKASVKFLKHDILREEIPFQDLDVIVSNPPYIAFSEKEQMQANVVEFEPHVALFVSDCDPLTFYKAIVAKANTALKKKGVLAVEINERFGREVEQLFVDYGFCEVKIVRDLSGKERVVRGYKL